MYTLRQNYFSNLFLRIRQKMAHKHYKNRIHKTITVLSNIKRPNA